MLVPGHLSVSIQNRDSSQLLMKKLLVHRAVSMFHREVLLASFSTAWHIGAPWRKLVGRRCKVKVSLCSVLRFHLAERPLDVRGFIVEVDQPLEVSQQLLTIFRSVLLFEFVPEPSLFAQYFPYSNLVWKRILCEPWPLGFQHFAQVESWKLCGSWLGWTHVRDVGWPRESPCIRPSEPGG